VTSFCMHDAFFLPSFDASQRALRSAVCEKIAHEHTKYARSRKV
jgi:hypothetical protein